MDVGRLPPVELPDDALVLYEQMAVDDPDRTGNWRFLIRQDGGFYNARNEQLFVPDAQLTSAEPELFWNVPFPAEPQRRLGDEAVRELQRAIAEADLPALVGRPVAAPDERLVIADRWTARVDAGTCTVLAANREIPNELRDLRDTIDRLVAAAPAER